MAPGTDRRSAAVRKTTASGTMAVDSPTAAMVLPSTTNVSFSCQFLLARITSAVPPSLSGGGIYE
jgi:hypothetical protein